MTPLLSFAPGWNFEIPAGTMLIRADVVMNRRPGPGGFAAIIEASDLIETIIIRGGVPDGTTEDVVDLLVSRLAAEIGGNRAVIMTRSPIIGKLLTTAFKRFKMIRMLLNCPLGVADATRQAAVMAERADQTRQYHNDRLLSARYAPCEEFSENQDSGDVHRAIDTLLKTLKSAKLNLCGIENVL